VICGEQLLAVKQYGSVKLDGFCLGLAGKRCHLAVLLYLDTYVTIQSLTNVLPTSDQDCRTLV
jgi:hypothetical protein